MRKILTAILATCCLAAGDATLRAQEQPKMGPPKVILIGRESVKYGKTAGHEKNEAGYPQAEARAKGPEHYFAITSMSGASEAWFIFPFDSFDAVEKSNKFLEEHPELQAQLSRLDEKDSEFVSESRGVIAYYNEKMSYHANVDIAQMRYFEVETVRLRPGHDKEWEELIKLVNSTLDKAKIDAHVAFFDAVYGAPSGTVLIFSPHKSLAEVDAAATTDQKAFNEALGENGMKRLSELEAATVERDETNLFSFNPTMSYPPDEWVKEDPSFWKPKPAPAAKAAAAAKKKTDEAAAPKP